MSHLHLQAGASVAAAHFAAKQSLATWRLLTALARGASVGLAPSQHWHRAPVRCDMLFPFPHQKVCDLKVQFFIDVPSFGFVYLEHERLVADAVTFAR